jgi:HEXXH motif-containing protein
MFFNIYCTPLVNIGKKSISAYNILFAANDNAFSAECFHALSSEWEALNSYLTKELEKWPGLAEKWELNAIANDARQWKNLALPVLTAHKIVSSLQSKTASIANDKCVKWESATVLKKEISVPGLAEVTMNMANPAFDEESELMSHPDMPASTAIDKNATLSSTKNSLLEAFSMITNASQRSVDVVTAGLSNIVVLELPANMPEGECISFTSRSSPGTVFLSNMPPILFAESLIHESAHNVLYSACRLREITSDDHSLHSSPLRPDPRPISGIIHQVLVLHYLVDFYKGLRECTDIPKVKRNERQIEKRYKKLDSELKQGVETLKSCDGITDLGEDLLQLISNDIR